MRISLRMDLRIRQVFEGLVNAYGTSSSSSTAIDAADPGHMPSEDILGNPRPVGLGPDIGAVEYGVKVYFPLVFNYYEP